MADQQPQSGVSATLDTPSGGSTPSFSPDLSLFSAEGTIQNAGEGSSALILNENGDPVDTVWTNSHGEFRTRLRKGTYKVQARDLSGKPIGEAKTLSFGKEGFNPISFVKEKDSTHDDTTHLLHDAHPRSNDPLASAEGQLDMSTQPQLNIDLTQDQIQKTPEYSKLQEKIISEKQIAWMQKNPGKTWDEWRKDPAEQAYFDPKNDMYGREVSARFRQEHADIVGSIEKQEKEKVVANYKNDSAYKQYEEQSIKAAKAAVRNAEEEWKKNGKKGDFDPDIIYDQEKLNYAKAFTDQFGTKAKAYAKNDVYLSKIQDYYDRKEAIKKEHQFISQSLANPTPTRLDIKVTTSEIQQDSRYKALAQQVIEERQREWQQQHPGAALTEWAKDPQEQKYLSSFDQEVESRFRGRYANLAAFYDARAKTSKIKSNQAIFEQYEAQSNKAAQEAVQRAYQAWLQGDKKQMFDKDQIYKAEKYRMAAQFVSMYHSKAELFSDKDPYLKSTLSYFASRKSQLPPPQNPPAKNSMYDDPRFKNLEEKLMLSAQNQWMRTLPREKYLELVEKEYNKRLAQDTRSQNISTTELLGATQSILSNAVALEQAALQEEALSRAQIIEQSKEQIQAAQQAQLFQQQIREEDQEREEQEKIRTNKQRKNPRRAIDRINSVAKNARNLKKRSDQVMQGVRVAIQLVRAIPPPVLGGILAIIAIILLALIIILYILGFFKSGQEKPVQTIQQLSLTITGPTQASVTDTLKYDIRITYIETPQIPYENITVQYKVPENAQYVESTGGADVNNQTGVVSWKLARPENRSGFSIIIRPTKDNIVIENQVIASSTTGGLPYIPGSGIIDTRSTSLADTFKQSSQKNNIPVAFLKAIAKKESGVLGYQQDEYDKFNTTDWFVGKVDNAPRREDNHPDIIRGYGYNTCLYLQCYVGADVRGAMQFDLPAWNNVKGEVSPIVGHDAERRYVRDVILGSGVYVRKKTEAYKDRFGPFGADWTEAQVKAMARSYCGGNPDADVKYDRACGVTRNGIRYGYDEIVWEYYKEFKALGN